MSLKKIDPLSISLRLYFYKLKGYSVLLYGLILAQIIALLFSLNGISYMSSNNGELSVSVNTYSASLVIVFSLVWIFYTAIQLTTKRYKRIEIPLVTNNITGHLSDIGFLMTACFFGGLTSSLAGVLLRVIIYFTFDRSQVIVDQFFLPFIDLLLGAAVSALYMILISAIGYLIGVLTKVSMAFVIVIPTVILGLLRVYADFVQTLVAFFTRETSFPLFVLKVLITSMLLFGFSFLLSNRREAVQ
ncbi:hypothetical protein [Desulfosporosinus hippei]|uniref:ABC-2 family transporter protein n=1 Tax=Desulfosporosinus hippei DSM 8344 TaxID=1121419 RepID=A0A1G7RKJ6_9FIRM|nr:hypothetical protein [Desulfosporosinus hippei]SDG11225.1 hypothetical protein SAMN05443529_101111 [Desulfosporosinus hippei DSM 8344]